MNRTQRQYFNVPITLNRVFRKCRYTGEPVATEAIKGN